MSLTIEQAVQLLQLVASAKRDEIGCDDCSALLDQFAQAELDGRTVPAALEAVRRHIEQCRCCRGEYDALLTALREVS